VVVALVCGLVPEVLEVVCESVEPSLVAVTVEFEQGGHTGPVQRLF
jgi:hypothetical protein